MAVPVAWFAGTVPDEAPVLFDDAPQGVYIAPGMKEPGWLVSLPPNACTPSTGPDGAPNSVRNGLVADLTRRAEFRIGAELPGSPSVSWGFYDMSPDGLPLAGPLPGVERCLVVAGLSGSGLQVAPALGRVVSRYVDDATDDPLLRALHPARFPALSAPAASAAVASVWEPAGTAGGRLRGGTGG